MQLLWLFLNSSLFWPLTTCPVITHYPSMIFTLISLSTNSPRIAQPSFISMVSVLKYFLTGDRTLPILGPYPVLMNWQEMSLVHLPAKIDHCIIDLLVNSANASTADHWPLGAGWQITDDILQSVLTVLIEWQGVWRLFFKGILLLFVETHTLK